MALCKANVYLYMVFLRNAFFYSLIAALVWACNAPQQISRQNTAFTYYKDASRLSPEFKVYHRYADSSEVYFTIPQSKLLYIKKGISFESKVKITYYLFDNFDTKIPTDSGTVHYAFIQKADTNTAVNGNFRIKAVKGKQYVAQFIFYDENRKIYNNSIVEVDKEHAFSAQYYLLKSYSDSSIIYKPYLAKDQAFSIFIPDLTISRLYIKYYKEEILPARPPFSNDSPQTVKPDTVLTVEAELGQSAPVQWLSEGLYIITTDTASTYGLPILRTYATYPEITQPEHVLKPLRYLTSKEEYDRLVKNDNTKKAVDDYWLRAASTPAHAREVLKAFYTGVSYANKFFTTTREGWKTDRGMVYCIFGQPYSVYRSGNTETWIYGTSNTPFTPVFIFEKHTDGLAGDDYFLRRSDLLKPYWYEMVENWRNGRLPY